MPRQPRRDAPGALQHVMLRGIERRHIFVDDADRRDFVARLARLLRGGGFLCFAWALMPNHVHLLLKTGATPLPRLMARLGTGYATRFNRRHDRVGHLFQNRYKSILVERESHLHKLILYVHANPLRAGLVSSVAALEHYPWTGHAALLGRASQDFLSSKEVLGWFGPNVPEARHALRALMEEEAKTPPREVPAIGAGLESHAPLPAEALDTLLNWVCAQVGARPAEVMRGRKTTQAVHARAITVFLATARLNLRAAEVSRILDLESGATSRAAARGEQLLRAIQPAKADEV